MQMDMFSISELQASAPAHTDLSWRSYVTYSAISNDLKSQELAVLDQATCLSHQRVWYSVRHILHYGK